MGNCDAWLASHPLQLLHSNICGLVITHYFFIFFGEVSTHGLLGFFPLLLTNDSPIDDFNHVSMDLSPNYDVDPPIMSR